MNLFDSFQLQSADFLIKFSFTIHKKPAVSDTLYVLVHQSLILNKLFYLQLKMCISLDCSNFRDTLCSLFVIKFKIELNKSDTVSIGVYIENSRFPFLMLVN